MSERPPLSPEDVLDVLDASGEPLCVVCHASFRVDLTRCAACRAEQPITEREDAA